MLNCLQSITLIFKCCTEEQQWYSNQQCTPLLQLNVGDDRSIENYFNLNMNLSKYQLLVVFLSVK
jgi:hypothetical protein